MRIQNLNKTFRGRAGTVVALDGVSLDIRRGEIFGIIGLSGAGKMHAGAVPEFSGSPDRGQGMDRAGRSWLPLSGRELRAGAERTMGMIFQQFNLLHAAHCAGQRAASRWRSRGLSAGRRGSGRMELLRHCGPGGQGTRHYPVAAYPAARSSGWPLPGPWQTIPRSCSATRRPAPWTRTTTRSILALLKAYQSARMGITIVVITHEMAVIEEICQRVAIIDSQPHRRGRHGRSGVHPPAVRDGQAADLSGWQAGAPGHGQALLPHRV